MDSKPNWENTKASFCEMVHQDLLSGTFLKAYPDFLPVANVEAGYDLGRIKCDLVVSHSDDSITVFECLPAGLDYCDYLAGIGRLIHTRVQFEGYQHEVRFFLAVLDKTDADLGFACLDAGINYVPFGSVDEHNNAEVAPNSVAGCNAETEQ